MDVEKIKAKLNWNHKFENEFKTRDYGYTFVIDVIDGKAMVSLYRFSPFGVKSEPLDNQPPSEMITDALLKQGVEVCRDGLYYIDDAIKEWIEKNILQVS